MNMFETQWTLYVLTIIKSNNSIISIKNFFHSDEYFEYLKMSSLLFMDYLWKFLWSSRLHDVVDFDLYYLNAWISLQLAHEEIYVEYRYLTSYISRIISFPCTFVHFALMIPAMSFSPL